MAHNAPGKHYRKGLTLSQMFAMFPDDDTAEAWFINRRWPDGVRCPHCGCDNIQDGARHRSQRYRCRGCRTAVLRSHRDGAGRQQRRVP